MKLVLSIEMGNNAFVGRATEESARILRDAAKKIEEEQGFLIGRLFKLMDVNGNTVGEVAVE